MLRGECRSRLIVRVYFHEENGAFVRADIDGIRFYPRLPRRRAPHRAPNIFANPTTGLFPGDIPLRRVTALPFVVNESHERGEAYRRLARVPRRFKSRRGVFASERFAGRIDFSRRNPTSSSPSSFRITAILSRSAPGPSPFLSPLPASFYRAGRGIAFAKIAAAPVCVSTTLMPAAPANWPILAGRGVSP